MSQTPKASGYNLSFLIKEPTESPEIQERQNRIKLFKSFMADLQERKSGTSPLLKISGCPSYLIIEWELFNSVVYAGRGDGLSIMINYGLDIILDFPEIIALDRVTTDIRSAPAPSLDIKAKSVLYKLIGTSTKPGFVIYPSAMTGLEQIVIRADQKILGRLSHWSQRLGMSRNSLAALSIGQGLIYFSVCDVETVACVKSDEIALREKATSWHTQIASLLKALQTKRYSA